VKQYMATLIFDNVLSGHHLEYIHYIYNGACKRIGEEFVFAVPKQEWNNVREKCEWPHADNIRWVMLDDYECQDVSKGSMLVRCFKLSRLVKRVALNENVSKIKLISLAGVIPFLPLMLPGDIKLSGIIYKIYLRAPKKGFRSLIDKFRYTIMARSRSMDKVFILNDPRSAERLNKIYDSRRFISLADPVPQPDMNEVKNLRSILNIPSSAIVFLHFGAMDKRKGTLEILRALNVMPKQEHFNRYFIFAGRVGDNLKDQFYSLAKDAESKGAHIIIRDEFCSYELLHSLCHTSDVILIPYLLTDLSSGALGYAALHHKPVIGPASGLIGELINDNNLGLTLSCINPEMLAKSFSVNIPYEESMYAEKNSIYLFTKTILDS